MRITLGSQKVISKCYTLFVGKHLSTYNRYNIVMLANKRIPVTEAVWVELSDLKTAGQTYSQLLEEMIEDRKKARFFRDMERIEEEGEFVEFPW